MTNSEYTVTYALYQTDHRRKLQLNVMNTYQNWKLVYYNVKAERCKISGNSCGNFSKDIFPGIPGMNEREFPVVSV